MSTFFSLTAIVLLALFNDADANFISRVEHTAWRDSAGKSFPRIERDDEGHVQKLSLSQMQLSSDDLKAIGHLKTLRNLDLFRTNITNSDLQQLIHELPQLQGLNLTSTRISDAAIDDIMKLESLRSLCLGDVDVTPEAVGRLNEHFLKNKRRLSLGYGRAVGGPGAKSELALPIRNIVAWLPWDTDTLEVARSFSMLAPEAERQKNPVINDFLFGAQLSALEGLWDLDEGKYLASLAGAQVDIALRGSRNVEIVSNFGSLRSEGCAIVVFAKPLENEGKDWTDLLRRNAKQVRRIGNCDVFVFDSTTVMEGGKDLKSWQGTFLALLNPKTLLCATSDKYLEEVLKNVEKPPVVRALADTLPEWQHVDTTAPGWLLRHVRVARPNGPMIGVTFTASQDQCRIVYLMASTERQDPKQFFRSRWLGKDPIVDSEMPYKFEQLKDGEFVVSAGPEAFEPENMMFLWRIYSLTGEH
jgi:hypothetical protein